MKFLIITHVIHQINQKNQISAYAPYVREMNLWFKHVDEVIIVAHQTSQPKSVIDWDYEHENIDFRAIPEIEFTSFKTIFSSILKLPKILKTIYKACKEADHIHLRCPGNIGLLGCIVQIFFPKKTKTAKYAGNWNPSAVQPMFYNLQKWLLSNTFLTKNIHVLVYGKWENQTKNIKSFFTASFSDSDKIEIQPKSYSEKLKYIFIGNLVEGKRPLFAIQVIEKLIKNGVNLSFELYGDGILKPELQAYISNNHLENQIFIKGNVTPNEIKTVLLNSHFLILPSKSEGWPKAIAEAMFFGVIPISTNISCVPFMLDYGKSGILIEQDINQSVKQIMDYLNEQNQLIEISKSACHWSQQYTLESFEKEIIKLLKFK